MEIRSLFTQEGSQAGSYKWHTMMIQASSRNGDPKLDHAIVIYNMFTTWRSKPVHKMEIRSWFTQWGSMVGSHKGGAQRGHTMDMRSRLKKWSCKPAYTFVILAASDYISEAS